VTLRRRVFAWLVRLAVLAVAFSVIIGVAPLVLDWLRTMTFPALLAWLVIFIAVPANWLVVVGLLRLSRASPNNRVLRDRLLVAVMLAAVVTVFGVVFVNNGMESPPLGLPQTQVLTRVAILSLAIPAIYWLSLYRRRR
jgi:hypothetical protein